MFAVQTYWSIAIVAVVVIGPDRLPKFAKDAAQLIRSLREMATGAREQLRDELGPEFADVDLRNLNPRTALTRAVFGDDDDLESLRRMDPRRWDMRGAAQDALFGRDDDPAGPPERIDMTKHANGHAPNGHAPNGSSPNGSTPNGSTPNGSVNGSAGRPTARPRPRPRPAAPAASTTPYDDDAT